MDVYEGINNDWFVQKYGSFQKDYQFSVSLITGVILPTAAIAAGIRIQYFD